MNYNEMIDAIIYLLEEAKRMKATGKDTELPLSKAFNMLDKIIFEQ